VTEIERAVEVLRAGGLVAFPTETVYGLGADASNEAALHRLYAVKGRPSDHPVIVHLGSAEMLDDWAVDVPDFARALAGDLWPGPLTLVLRRADHVPDAATGGLDTVGLRVPGHPLALELLHAFVGGIAAPSANRFGRVSPTTADAVRSDLGDDVELVLDGGPCTVGVESTIVDCTGEEVRILRQGGVTTAVVARITGMQTVIGGSTPAPGTLDAHYAPDATVRTIATGELDALAADTPRAGLLGLVGDVHDVPAGWVALATPADSEEYARVLYAALRQADAMGLPVVVAVLPSDEGIGVAVCDRLRRAAASR
jgi:L-threonylcarbamoyladenylate synthase